jgi:dTDP-4-amino-4,6-dideoxygalactose transaminase
MIPLVDLKAQYTSIKSEIDAAIESVLERSDFIQGMAVREFEAAFARYCDTRHAVGVASGTAALRLALQACGIGPGDEVITAAHTFFATAEAISQIGARPVFVDIDPQTYTIDPNQVEDEVNRRKSNDRSVTGNRVRAIIPVHLYGQPADMDALMDIARHCDLWVIEDAAQAHGAEYKGRRCSNLGHLACFSFYPGKNLGAYGDAGMVIGNDEALLAKVGRLRDHGRTSKYEHWEVGWGERLDTLQAAILRAKLPHLEAWTEARRVHARYYTELLTNCDVITPYETPYVRHVYHLYVIRTPRRDDLLAHLKAKGIGAGIHYPVPLHRQPAYLTLGYGDVHLPLTEQAAAEVLSLPMYPELTEDQIVYVIEAVREFLH